MRIFHTFPLKANVITVHFAIIVMNHSLENWTLVCQTKKRCNIKVQRYDVSNGYNKRKISTGQHSFFGKTGDQEELT